MILSTLGLSATRPRSAHSEIWEYTLNITIDEGCVQNVSETRFSMALNRARTWRSPIHTNISTIWSTGTACFVAVLKFEDSTGLIWLCHNRDRNDSILKFRFEIVSSTLFTVQQVFNRILIEIQTRYMGRRKKEFNWYGSSSYKLLMPDRTFDNGPRILVVGIFHDALWTTSSMKVVDVLGAVITAATKFAAHKPCRLLMVKRNRRIV